MDAETNASGTTSATTAKTSASADAPGTAPDNAGKTHTQADIDRIVAERLKQEREKAKKDAETVRLTEEGKHKELAEQRQQRIAELEADLARRDRAALATRVATAAGLPETLADRLRGETEAELQADAAALAALLPKAPAGAADAGNPTNPARAGGKPTSVEDQINARWAKTKGGGWRI